ncbi:MAG TPA: hypothetical protein VK869_00745 [Rubrobacteraceae bacterium]|nr:hypothetical protein [Rubrobacteraceae bacterium]
MRRTAPAGILMPFCALASAGPAFAHGFGETFNLPLPLWGAGGTVLISLVPIAVTYQVAHYYAYLLIQGQSTVSLL